MKVKKEGNTTKILSIIAIIIAVIGLAMGFATFSSTLTITSSATVTPSADTFKVVFGKYLAEEQPTSIRPQYTCSSGDTTCLSATYATLTETTISNINVTFKEPGNLVQYTFEAVNLGEYDAYLNKIEFENVKPICTPGEGTTASLVEAACEGITYSITVDDSTENHISTTSTVNNIDGFKLVKTADDTYDPFNGIQVMISYSESARADGPFDVSLGYIKLYYSTAD